jgi:hypothetical protein
MAELLIDFEWRRDTKGYRLVSGKVPRPGKTVLTGDPGRPQTIVRSGGKLETYRPLDQFQNLYAVFAEHAQNAEGVLRFVENFGPLTRSGFDPAAGDEVPNLLREAKAMRMILELRDQRPHELASRIGPAGMSLPDIKAAVVADPVTGGLRLRLSPPDLLRALWLQLGQALSGVTKLRRCRQCGIWFEAGPGTRRRGDADFCSDAHRIAFNSQKRTQGR